MPPESALSAIISCIRPTRRCRQLRKNMFHLYQSSITINFTLLYRMFDENGTYSHCGQECIFARSVTVHNHPQRRQRDRTSDPYSDDRVVVRGDNQIFSRRLRTASGPEVFEVPGRNSRRSTASTYNQQNMCYEKKVTTTYACRHSITNTITRVSTCRIINSN